MFENFPELMNRISQATLEQLPDSCGSALLEASFDAKDDGKLGMNINLADQTNKQYVEVTQDIASALIDLHIACDEENQSFQRCEIELNRDDAEGNWSFGINFTREDDEDGVQGGEGALDFNADTMSQGFRKLLNQHVMASIEKDHILEDFRTDWNVNLDTQILEFADSFSCRIDLMGSVSNVSNTWLWAWANTALGAPEAAISKSKSVLKLGEKHGIFEFTESKLDFQQIHPDLLAFVVCGLCHADFYYWGNFDNGAVLLLGYTDKISSEVSSDVSRVVTVIPKALQIAGQYFDHKKAVLHYLKQRDYRGGEKDGKIEAHSPDGTGLVVTFDELGRLTKLHTQNA